MPDGEVTLLDQPGRQAPGRGVEGGAGPDDAATHDEHVELAVDHRGRQGAQCGLPCSGAERTGLGHLFILPDALLAGVIPILRADAEAPAGAPATIITQT